MGRETVTADANTAIFFQAGRGYRVSHPCDGGDDCTTISPSEELLGDALGAVDRRAAEDPLRPFAFTHGRVSPQAFAAQSRLFCSLARGALGELEVDERVFDLLEQLLRGVCAQSRRGTRSPGRGAATHAAGLSFEGLHPRVMQNNTGMFGPAYRELLKRAELTYDTAAAGLSTEEPPEPGFSLQSSIIAGKSGPEAADIVLGALPAENRSAKRAAVELIRLAAKECLADLRALAGICGRKLQRVSVVGGFAENQLFLKLLREDGIDVVIPPHAAAGADMATAVETIRRLQLAAGNAQSFAEILAAMP